MIHGSPTEHDLEWKHSHVIEKRKPLSYKVTRTVSQNHHICFLIVYRWIFFLRSHPQARRILGPWPGSKPATPAMAVPSLNHLTVRGVLLLIIAVSSFPSPFLSRFGNEKKKKKKGGTEIDLCKAFQMCDVIQQRKEREVTANAETSHWWLQSNTENKQSPPPRP